MPKLDPDIQQSFWKLANALAKALRASGGDEGADPQWRVSALASRAWRVSHPDLPLVDDQEGMTKDTLLQFHVQQDEGSGLWFVVAQNKVVGPDSHASPRALIVAKKKTPPGEDWNFDEIAEAAANFFRQQKADLVEKANTMMPAQAPGAMDMGENPAPGSGGPAASRRSRLARGIVAGSPTLMTPIDFDEYAKLTGTGPNDIPEVKRDIQRRLSTIGKMLSDGKSAWKGHSYSYRAKDPSLTKWEASDGGELNASSLLGMMIHALGRDVDVIETSGFADWIIKAPKDQASFETSH